MPELYELPFKDMYIRIDADTPIDYPSRYHRLSVRGEPYVRGNITVPEEFSQMIHDLRPMLREFKKDNFAFDLKGIRVRGVRYRVVNKQQWVSLRRIAVDLPDLDSLGFAPAELDTFRSWGMRTGLIIIGGATGSGKTTTAVGLLRDFLLKFGGTLYTIEDPVEFVMQGEIGERGFVIQREVQEDPEWAEAVKDALRSAPHYIFLGEVRTAAAARQLLRAATSGHLAICTVHGSSAEETIGAILQIAASELGPMAYNLLAEGLTGVVYQNIVNGKPEVVLLETGTGGKGGVDPVKVAIRGNKLIYLGTEIERQAAVRARAPKFVPKPQARVRAVPSAVDEPEDDGFSVDTGSVDPGAVDDGDEGQSVPIAATQPLRQVPPTPAAQARTTAAIRPQQQPQRIQPPIATPAAKQPAAPPPPPKAKGGWFRK